VTVGNEGVNAGVIVDDEFVLVACSIGDIGTTAGSG
jgi:hypothetical protein